MTQDQDKYIPRWLILLGFFAFGCAAALGQVLLLREFLVTFHGTEICVGAFYGSWFLWIAIGAWWGPRLLARFLNDSSSYLVLHLALPVAVLTEIVLLRSLRPLLGVDPEALLPLETLLISSMLLTAPAGAVIGALFPITGKLLAGPSRDPISLGYAWESAGSLAGGVAFTYLLATRFDPLVTLSAMGILEGVTVLVVAAGARNRRAVIAAVVGVLAYASLLTPLGTALDQASERTRWNSLQRGYELVAVRHTPYSHVAVGRDASGQYGIFYDGIQRTTFPDAPTFRHEAAVAMSQHPHAKRVLVLGGGAEGLVQQLLRYPVQQIDCVEDDPWALALVKRYLPIADRQALSDPRVRIVNKDGRLYVNHRGHGRRYDLIISRASDPTTASTNRYFTREFFRGVKAMLAPGGAVIVHTVDIRAYAGDAALKTAASVLHTLRDVFVDVQLVAHHGNLFAASVRKGQVSPEPALLASRQRAIGMPGAALLADQLAGSVSLERSRALRAQLDVTTVALNTDTRPTTYFHAIQLWGRMSGSELPAVFAALERAGVWLFVIILLVLGLSRLTYRLVVPNPERSQRTNTAIAIAVTGFASMALQVMILMGFQSHLGSLYQKVGLLTGAFMMGLAGGALVGRALSGRFHTPRLLLAFAMCVLAAFSLAVPATMDWLGQAGNGFVAAVYFGMSLVSGVITGCLFPLSVATYDPDERDVGRTAGVIDAADHVGACLGGLLAGTVIIPIAGQHVTAQVVALAAVVPAVLLGLDWLLAHRGWRMEPAPARRWSFPWVRASWIMGALVVAVLACSALVRCRPPAEDPATVRKPFPHRPRYRQRVPDGKKARAPADAPASKRGRLIAVGFETRHVAHDIRGYGGPINLWVRFDAEGTLEQVVLRSHQETPSYLKGIPRWLRLLEGHRFKQPLVGKGGVDAVSGATVTSEAILRILDRARARAASDLLGLAPPRPKPATPSFWARLFDGPKAWIVAGFLVLMLVAYRFGGWLSRLGIMVTSVALLGFWLNVPFATVDVAGLSLGVVPGAGEKGVLVLGVLLISLAFGQVWCGYGCPFGALQELVWLILHPRGVDGAAGLGNARQISPELEMRARYVKFGVLSLVLSFFWLSGDGAYLALDPMTTAFTRQMAGHTIWMLVILGLVSLLYFRPFCRYLCPAGAFLALSNKVRLADRFARPRALSRCDLGVTRQDHVDCLKCNRCLTRRDR